MNEKRKHLTWIGLSVILIILVLVPAVVLAQEDDPDVGDPTCNPPLERLAIAMGEEDCDTLVALRGQGIGVGQIMNAWVLSEGTGVPLGELLERKQEGLGWGQIKAAYRFSGGDPATAEQLFQLREDGLGWGQIMQAQAIAAAGLSEELTLDSIADMMKEGLGWGDIRQQYDLPPGPPPWAGGGKYKVKNVPPGQAMRDEE